MDFQAYPAWILAQGTLLSEADKQAEVKSEFEAVSAELKPGERKVISDGSEGPIVEIIKRTSAEAFDEKKVKDFKSNDEVDNNNGDEVGE